MVLWPERVSEVATRALLEFSFTDGLRVPMATFCPRLVVPSCHSRTRDAFVFTIVSGGMDATNVSNTLTDSSRRVVMQDAHGLTSVVSRLRSLSGVLNTWFVAYDLSDHAVAWVADDALHPDRGRIFKELETDPEVYYCGILQPGAVVPITPRAAYGHSLGFRLIASSSKSYADDYLQGLLTCSDGLPHIHRMLSEYDWCFPESQFEIAPYGDEDRAHIQIVYSPAFTKNDIRGVICDAYGLGLYRLPLTSQEFTTGWERGAAGFERRLLEWRDGRSA